MVTYGRHHICYIKLIPFCVDTPVICKRLRDVIMLVYAAHLFDDNILYFCSKISKKLYIIGNVYANIVFFGRRVQINTKKKCDDDNSIPTQHNLLHIKARSFFLPLVSPLSLPSLPLLPSSLSFPPSTSSLHYQNNVC